MAEFLSEGNVDISQWTNTNDSNSHHKRSILVQRIIEQKRQNHLRTILATGWNVNEVLHMYDENQCKWLHKTALQKAARAGWNAGVRILLDTGAKCTTQDGSQNPLALALCNQDCPPDLIERLLKHGADPNDHDYQLENIPLLRAIQNSKHRYADKAVLQLLLENGANPHIAYSVNVSQYGEDRYITRSALNEAAMRGWTEGLRMLLDAGAKYPKSTALENPLALALQNRDSQANLIELLLKNDVDPNLHDGQPENIPLLCAIKRCKYHQSEISFVKLLLNAGAKCKTSSELQNPLTLALQNEYIEPDLIELLLRNGADPNAHDGHSENIPLLCAIKSCREIASAFHLLKKQNSTYWKNRTAIVELLLVHGADPNVEYTVNIIEYGQAKWVQRTALHEAISQNCTTVVRLLLYTGAKCAKSDVSLALKNHNCHPNLIELLLKHGADPNQHGDQLEDIPILWAIEKLRHGPNGITIVRLLLQHGAEPNVVHKVNTGTEKEPKWECRNALRMASEMGWIEVLQILFDAGVKCMRSVALENPLILALKGDHNCHPKLIELLLKHGADPNQHGDQLEDIPILLAIEKLRHGPNGITIVRLLLQHGAEPNVVHKVNTGTEKEPKWECRNALCMALEMGWIEVLQILFDAGAKCMRSVALENPLILALKGDHCSPELIDLLLQHGADPNYHKSGSDIPLVHALREHLPYKELVPLLLEHGANPNVVYWRKVGIYKKSKRVQRKPIHEAVELGWTEGVRMLLKAGANFKMPSSSENTLVLALKGKHCSPDLINILLEHGVDPNPNNRDNDSPLVLAFRRRFAYKKLVPVLLNHGANPNVVYRINTGTHEKPVWVDVTPIHEAISRGWNEGVKLLLDAGGICSGLGTLTNPLELALQDHKCPAEIIELLLEHGAGAEVRDSSSLHAVSRYIFQAPSWSLLDFFFQQGGNINMEDGKHRSLLECAVRDGGHSNRVRWLLRHGANVLPRFALLKWYISERNIRKICCSETPLILLQAGMRASRGAQKKLCNMELKLSTLLKNTDTTAADFDFTLRIMHRGLRYKDLKEIEFWGIRHNKKSPSMEYCPQQMDDLLEFSDRSLDYYPEDINTDMNDTGYIKHHLDQIHRVLEFLSQPQSLQWYCRRSVRENLASLQPSLVKSLHIPGAMKRYILCHDI